MSRNEELQDRILEFLQAMAAPALRKFRVVGDINVMADPPPLPFRGEMTQLEDLHLDGVQLSWPHCRFQKLKSLTLIREIEISFPALLAFLSSCPSIVNLTLDLSIVDRGNETQVVTMPALERFAFNVSIRSIRFIWNHIYLPKLHSLALDPVGSEYRPALKVLTSPHPAMPTSPLPSWSLTSLGLWPNTEVSGFTGALFHELPNVRVLFLCPNGPIASSTSINDLSMHSKSTYPPSANHDGPALVLPRLTTLILAEGQCSYEAVICVSWDLLQETVIRRRDAGVPLKKLFVEYENEWADEPPEEAAWLLENLDAVGMIPKTWKLQTMNMEYTEDWCAIEAEPAGTWAFERLCERLGFTLFKPNGGQPAATSDDCTEEY
ncbi:hypothetical protein DENSPDRAFT_881603 [Dentipellis sp. KUC8613]|nr:hypothetical protein DENSPDRAFT_881603 [Dentipellis sp. KUC8613]